MLNADTMTFDNVSCKYEDLFIPAPKDASISSDRLCQLSVDYLNAGKAYWRMGDHILRGHDVRMDTRTQVTIRHSGVEVLRVGSIGHILPPCPKLQMENNKWDSPKWYFKISQVDDDMYSLPLVVSQVEVSNMKEDSDMLHRAMTDYVNKYSAKNYKLLDKTTFNKAFANVPIKSRFAKVLTPWHFKQISVIDSIPQRNKFKILSRVSPQTAYLGQAMNVNPGEKMLIMWL